MSHDEEGHGVQSHDTALGTSRDHCSASPCAGKENCIGKMKEKELEEPERAHVIFTQPVDVVYTILAH